MRIGVIGAGWLGGTVGRLWVKAGHEVLFSSRHPEELVSMAQELGPRASVGTPRQAAEFGTVLLFVRARRAPFQRVRTGPERAGRSAVSRGSSAK
ncbi:NAD(P)-binding domain-containing protein [Myxococcus sp. 1LA]